jgi:hypothetical protein
MKKFLLLIISLIVFYFSYGQSVELTGAGYFGDVDPHFGHIDPPVQLRFKEQIT